VEACNFVTAQHINKQIKCAIRPVQNLGASLHEVLMQPRETRSSVDAVRPHYVPQLQNIALEKACNKGMTFKDTQGYHNCCY